MFRFAINMVLFSLVVIFGDFAVAQDAEENPNNYFAFDDGQAEYFMYQAREPGTIMRLKHHSGTVEFLANNRIEIKISGRPMRRGQLTGCVRSLGVPLTPMYFVDDSDRKAFGQSVCNEKAIQGTKSKK